jgi:subtilisin family serine protease
VSRDLSIGLVDTGVNGWHSHVRGRVDGCALHVADDGTIREDDDFRDTCGHGTAVAGVLRAGLPQARIFAVRVFDASLATYPTLVARGILHAAAAGCEFINLSLAVLPGPGTQALADACAAALRAGCTIVAAEAPPGSGALPAALPGVHRVIADDRLDPTRVRQRGPRQLAASGRARDLAGLAHANFAGASFACARGLVHLARRGATPDGRQ